MESLKTTGCAYPDNYPDIVSGYKKTARPCQRSTPGNQIATGKFRRGRIPNRAANQAEVARFDVSARTNSAIGPILTFICSVSSMIYYGVPTIEADTRRQ